MGTNHTFYKFTLNYVIDLCRASITISTQPVNNGVKDQRIGGYKIESTLGK
jgi:hypothetical protein